MADEDLRHIADVEREADCLLTDEQVRAAVQRMADEINRVVGDREMLVMPVMLGGVVPAGLLIPLLRFPMELDYLHATRYRGETSGADLHWKVRPAHGLKGRSVLLIDDIYDEGLTLAAIRDWCLDQGAAQVLTAVLFEKLHDRNQGGMRPDFIGARVEDRYVFGFGMDYKHYLRNAAGVFAVKGL